MAKKTLTFDSEDVERLEQLYPDFASGAMSARELGSSIVKTLSNLGPTAIATSADNENPAQTDLRARLEQVLDENTALQQRLDEVLAENEALQHPKTSSDCTPSEVGEKLEQELEGVQLKYRSVLEELQQKTQTLDSFKLECQNLSEKLEQAQSRFTAQQDYIKELEQKLSTAKASLKDTSEQLKAIRGNKNIIALNPFILEILSLVVERANAMNNASYTTEDFVNHTIFRSLYEKHSYRFDYPITQREIISFAEKYYPKVGSVAALLDILVPNKDNLA